MGFKAYFALKMINYTLRFLQIRGKGPAEGEHMEIKQ